MTCDATLRSSLNNARRFVTCCARAVAFLGLRSGSTRVYRRSLRASGTSHPVRCARRTGPMSQTIGGERRAKAAAAQMTSRIDIDSGTGKLWPPKTHQGEGGEGGGGGGGDERREPPPNSCSPVRNCASSSPRLESRREVCAVTPADTCAGGMSSFVVCCCFQEAAAGQTQAALLRHRQPHRVKADTGSSQPVTWTTLTVYTLRVPSMNLVDNDGTLATSWLNVYTTTNQKCNQPPLCWKKSWAVK